MKRYKSKIKERIVKSNKDHSYNTLVLWWVEDNYPEYYDKSLISKRLTELMNKSLINISTDAEVKVADFMNMYKMSEKQIPSLKELEDMYL